MNKDNIAIQKDYSDALFRQLSRVGKAISSPGRLQILEILAQGERSVEDLSRGSSLSFANTSRHLQVLKDAGLVEGRKSGVRVRYRITDPAVGKLCDAVGRVARARLAEMEGIVRSYLTHRDGLEPVRREDLLERARSGQVTVLDVRPADEYRSGHLPGAVCVPLDDLEARLDDLPPGREVVAYCRGPYCILSYQAVEILRRHGYSARRLEGGFPQWVAAGFPIEQEG